MRSFTRQVFIVFFFTCLQSGLACFAFPRLSGKSVHGTHLARHDFQSPLTVNTGTLYLSICQNADTISLIDLLSVTDTVVGDTIYWSAGLAPLHGFVAVFDSAISAGDTLFPAGVLYAPLAGYSGTDTFTVYITSGGTIDTVSFSVNVIPLPVAGNLTATRDSLCEGDTIHITASVSGGQWSATNTNAAVDTGLLSAVLAGYDTVLYSVENTCGADTAYFPVQILPLANPGAIIGYPVCAGNDRLYSASVPGGTWSVSNPNALVDDTGLVTGVLPGLDTVYYSVSNSCGTRVATYVVSVDTPAHVPAISGLYRVCVGGTDTIGDIRTGGIWSVTNGRMTIASNDSMAVLSGLAPGLDTVLYVIVNGCGVFDDIETVRIDTFPVVYPIIVPNTVCVNYSATAKDTVPITSGVFTWTATNNHLSINNSGLIHGLTPGLDTIIFTCTNGCGAADTQKVMTVIPVPNAGIISGSDTLCIGETATYTDTTANGPGYWVVGAMSADSSYTVITPAAYGPYVVTYKMQSTCGSKSSAKTVQVVNPPNGLLTFGPTQLCLGATTTLTNYVKGGVWVSRNGTAAIDSFTGYLQTLQSGFDTIEYSFTNNCGTETVPFVQTINPVPPILNISRTENLLRVDSGYVGYQWTIDGTAIFGTWYDTLTASATGVYQVWVTNTSGCTTQSSFLDVSDIEPCLISDLHIYPNPAANSVFVRWCDYVNVRVSTIWGQTVLIQNHAHDIDISRLPDGNYIFGLYRDDGTRLYSKVIAKVSK